MDERIYLPPPDEGEDFSLTGERVKEARRAFSRSFLFIAVYIVSALVFLYGTTIAIMLIFGSVRGGAIVGSLAYTWIMQVLSMYIFALPLSYLIVKRIPRVKKAASRLSLQEFVVLFFVSYGAMTLGSVISNVFTNILSAILGYTVNNDTSDLILDTPVWIVILVAVIIGPIFEELIFRKILIDRMSVYGDRLAIVVSAVSFGIFHGNFSQVLYATAIGFIFGYVYSKTRNVIYTSLLHILLNFMGTVPTLLISDNLERIIAMSDVANPTIEQTFAIYPDVLTVYGVLIAQWIIALTGIGFLIYVLVKKLIKLPSHREIALPARALTKAVLFNAGAIIYLVVVAFEFLLSILP